jgi:hypothetical protein
LPYQEKYGASHALGRGRKHPFPCISIQHHKM